MLVLSVCLLSVCLLVDRQSADATVGRLLLLVAEGAGGGLSAVCTALRCSLRLRVPALHRTDGTGRDERRRGEPGNGRVPPG